MSEQPTEQKDQVQVPELVETPKEEPKLTRSLEKVNNSTYVLHINDAPNKMVTSKTYSKDEIRGIHEELAKGVKNVKENISNTKKKIAKITVEDTPELRALQEQMFKVQQLGQKTQLEGSLKEMEKTLEEHESQKREIELAMPELLRNA